MEVKRSSVRGESFGVKRVAETIESVRLNEIPQSIAVNLEAMGKAIVEDARSNSSILFPMSQSPTVDLPQGGLLAADLNTMALRNEQDPYSISKPLVPEQPKLILPYEVSITSIRGTFTHKVETMHDVDILLQYLTQMNRTQPTVH